MDIKLNAKIEGQYIKFDNVNKLHEELKKFDGYHVKITIEKAVKTRSDQANRALHLYFRLLSDTLNEHGLDIAKSLSKKVEHRWTPDLIKELIFKKIMRSLFTKRSTTQLKSAEINEIVDIITRHFGEHFGVETPTFPNIDQMLREQDFKNLI